MQKAMIVAICGMFLVGCGGSNSGTYSEVTLPQSPEAKLSFSLPEGWEQASSVPDQSLVLMLRGPERQSLVATYLPSTATTENLLEGASTLPGFSALEENSYIADTPVGETRTYFRMIEQEEQDSLLFSCAHPTSKETSECEVLLDSFQIQ